MITNCGRNISKLLRIFTLLLLASFCSLFAQKQEILSHISVNDGLSQSTIFAITQDSKGFLWFGTRGGGLNKYDGYDFHVYRNIPELPGSLSDNRVHSILEDSNKVLWIGTKDGGINRFDRASGQFRKYPLDVLSEVSLDKSVDAKCIFEDHSGRIWIGTKHRVFLYNKSEDSFDQGLVNAPFPVKGTTGICEDKQGFLYIATWDRLIRFHPEKESYDELIFQIDTINVFGERINPILLDSHNRLWLGTPEGLKTVNTEKDFSFCENELPALDWPESFSYIRAIRETKDGHIWLGTGDGLYRFSYEEADLKEYKNDLDNPSSLGHNSIYSIFEDRVGTLWIGTWNGISVLDQRKYEFKHYSHRPNDHTSLSSNIVSSFEEDKLGTWIGTEQGGLNFMNHDRTTFIAYKHKADDPHSLISNNVKSIFRDSNDDLWVGTHNGGLSLYEGDGKFTHFLEGHFIYSIAEMPEGKLYIGGRNGFHVMDLNTREISTNVFPTTSGITKFEGADLVLYTDSRNRLWVGTRNKGIYLFDATQATVKHFQSSKNDISTLSGNYVISICEDLNKQIWIGTSSGLNLFKESTYSFVRSCEQFGLENNVINGLIPDDVGRLWISTNSGIYSYNPVSGDLHHYDYLDGLQSNEFNRDAYYKNSSGEMFFGGVAGFNVFQPGDIMMNTDAPPVIITDLKLNNESTVPGAKNSPLKKDISDTEKIVLSHRQSSFSLDFVALNYLVPEKNRYAYMLDGFDKEFTQSGKIRTVNYLDLKPGNYTFRVIGSNNDGVWNKTGASLDIVVKGALWSSPKAILVYVITLLVLVVLLLKHIKKRIEKERALGLRYKLSDQKEDVSDSDGLNSVDGEFLEKVNGIVMEHISDPEFSVEDLMHEVGMSRSMLYRKFKVISKRNPSEYIRLLRLDHAADLLKEKKYTINEVAFMSGFGNVSYFNTCFKKHFGCSPGKYLS